MYNGKIRHVQFRMGIFVGSLALKRNAVRVAQVWKSLFASGQATSVLKNDIALSNSREANKWVSVVISIPFIGLVTSVDFALLLLIMNSTHTHRRFALIQHSKTFFFLKHSVLKLEKKEKLCSNHKWLTVKFSDIWKIYNLHYIIYTRTQPF